MLFAISFSCKKTETTSESKKESEGETINLTKGDFGSPNSCYDIMENDSDTSDVQTVLGNKLSGSPYSIAVMQQAAINLYGNSNGISINKLYVRFKPADAAQVIILDALDLDLYDYPLDYEILHEGDYYPQSGIGENDIPWYYAVVDPGFVPPSGIQYEILEQTYIPEKDIFLEAEAFRITGNSFGDSCGTVENILPTPCSVDPCGPNCPPSTGSENPCGSGGGTPVVNPKKPAGNITLWDNRLNGGTLLPVKQIRVIARNFLKTERVYTDNNGNFSFTKNFNKVNLIVKMKNNKTTVKGLFGWRLWNLTFPLKKNIGKYKGNLNNISYSFFRQENAKSRGMQDWVGVTVFNKRQDFDVLALQEGLTTLPDHLNLFVTSASGSASCPMFPHRYPNNNELLPFFVKKYIGLLIADPAIVVALNEITKANVDVLFGYNRALGQLDADDISETIFHELSHSLHYTKVGNDWWHQFVESELGETAENYQTQFDPYGQGNTISSPIIALAESWAYHYGRILADRVYGINFSSVQREQGINYGNDDPVTGLSSHLNLLEDFDPSRPVTIDPFRWIPQGLYYDLIDNRNDINRPFPRIFINDEVSNYTNQQFLNALGNDIFSLQNYRLRLLQQSGNSQVNEVVDLFSAYGY